MDAIKPNIFSILEQGISGDGAEYARSEGFLIGLAFGFGCCDEEALRMGQYYAICLGDCWEPDGYIGISARKLFADMRMASSANGWESLPVKPLPSMFKVIDYGNGEADESDDDGSNSSLVQGIAEGWQLAVAYRGDAGGFAEDYSVSANCEYDCLGHIISEFVAWNSEMV